MFACAGHELADLFGNDSVGYGTVFALHRRPLPITTELHLRAIGVGDFVFFAVIFGLFHSIGHGQVLEVRSEELLRDFGKLVYGYGTLIAVGRHWPMRFLQAAVRLPK